ncbi:MAG: ATP-binding protein [Flavobacteriales bacterium]
MNSFFSRYLFLLVFLSFCLFGKSQNKVNYDSVINLINKTNSIEEKKKIYRSNTPPFGISEQELKTRHKLLSEKINKEDKKFFYFLSCLGEAKFYLNTHNYELAEDKLNEILINYEKIDKQFYLETIDELAFVYFYQDKFKKSIGLIDSVLSSIKGDAKNKLVGPLYKTKGRALRALNFLNLSTKSFLTADSLLPENSNKLENHLDLGTNYLMLKDNEMAEKYFGKALKLNNKSFDEYYHNYIQMQFGALYRQQGNILKSDSILTITYEYFHESNDERMEQAIESDLILNNRIKGNYSEAIKGLKKHLLYGFFSNDSLYRSILFQKIAENYVRMKKGMLAQSYLDSAMLFAKISLPQEDINIITTQKKIAKLKGNYKKALLLDEELDSLQKILDRESNQIKSKELQFMYDTEKKEKENLLLKAENVQIEQEKKNQFYQLLIGIILLTLGLIVLYLLFKNRQSKNEKLKELDTLKSKFFESISHELRTPLTLIQLPVSKALEVKEPIPEKELKTIKYNAKRLQNLMDDLLSITRIEANKYPISITENNITEQTNILSAQFDSLAESNNIEYIKNIQEESILAHYDKEVYNKVLINLISNAIKYSDKGGKVEVNFKLENNEAILQISDQGKGIRKEDQQYIFDKFYRVDQNNENVPGSGIGLSIVKELIELIDGSISFESTEGQGTEFLVKFPLKEIETITEKSTIPTPTLTKQTNNQSDSIESVTEYDIDNAEKPILLVVEDNEELLSYIQKELSDDFKVFTANNGKLGIEKGLEVVPDLIISDWLMPEKNGIELCEAIKENEITSHVPVVMLTAKTEIEDKIQGFETGADAYVAKPFEMNVLKAQVQNIILQRKKLLEKFVSNDVSVSIKEFSERDLEFWNKLKSMVEKNLSNPDFSVQALADGLFVSRMQLNRKVKALINVSGSEYILKEKMNLAKNLLKNKDLQISEIGYRIGYDNVRSFGRVFKKETGKTPSEYRKDLS